MNIKDLFEKIIAIRANINGVIHFATGVFVKNSDERIFLVTAAHVARDTPISGDIYFKNLVTGMPNSVKISSLNPLNLWLYHPSADLAILQITTPDCIPNILNHCFVTNDFERSCKVVPNRETDVVMYGLPDVFQNLVMNAYTFQCHCASGITITNNQHTGLDYSCFYLDKPSFQGFSGGPVVVLSDNSFRCYGFISGTRSDATGGKFAIVTHSCYLFDLLTKI